MSLGDNFINDRIEINTLQETNKLHECVKKCTNMIKILKNNKDLCYEEEWNTAMWYGYYMMGKCNKYISSHHIATIAQLRTSLKYARESKELIESTWLIASIYEKINNKKNALKSYGQAIYYCGEDDDTSDIFYLFKGILLKDKSRINHSEKDLKASIKILKSIDIGLYESVNYKKEDLIDEAYEVLFNIYIYNFEITKENSYQHMAWNQIHNIENVILKRKLVENFNYRNELRLLA